MRDSRPILLVEDDDVDALTVKKALQHLKIPSKLVLLRNGEKALEYLKSETETKPSIIILDLNIPRIDGFELLKIIKADDKLKEIPVIVLTMSDVRQDINESFSQSVAGYIVKPIDYDYFIKSFGTLDMYWSLSELPSI
jgi:CheY-like chemotaxis protein